MSSSGDESVLKSEWEDFSSLDALLGEVQGNSSKVSGDAALARFSKERLRAIELGARTRADDCLSNVQVLARLLAQVLLDTDRPIRPADTVAAAQHLATLAQDCERWNLLAEHAATYRVQRPVAAEVARRWVRWAKHLGEWPDHSG
jgi:hypothetical protein